MQHSAPREYYGPRKLLPAEAYGHYANARLYGKAVDVERGDEALPPEWFVLCPNRITERREAAGYLSTGMFATALNSINYQRLRKLETGRVIVRESEYELIAQKLGIHVDELKLPLLTQSETVEWNGLWGPKKRIEEGGDHDAVILAAFFRFTLHKLGLNRHSLKTYHANTGVLGRLWHAEKPIDRHSDSGMLTMIQVTASKDWNDVIEKSQAAYKEGFLTKYIKDVHKPRVRYAPEDPDRRAPWTYETNAFRVKRGKRRVQTPFTPDLHALPMPYKKRKAFRQEQIQRRARLVVQTIMDSIVRLDMNKLYAEQLTGQKLEQYLLLSDIEQKTVVARFWMLNRCRTLAERTAAHEKLGISKERFRQLKADWSGVTYDRIKSMEFN